MAAGLALFDANGHLVVCNAAFRAVYPRIARSMPHTEGSGRETRACAASAPARHATPARNGAPLALAGMCGTTRVLRAEDGGWFQLDQQPTDTGGRLLLLTEVTGIKQREEACALLAAALEHAGDAIEVHDHRLRLVYANAAASRMTGCSLEEALGRHFAQSVRGAAAGGDQPEAPAAGLAPAAAWSGRIVSRRKDGQLVHQDATVSPLRDNRGRITHFVAIRRDVSEPSRSEAHLRYLAHHDPVTELPNRVLFQGRLNDALSGAGRTVREGALHLIDLDHFKDVNDTYGHATGDAFLRSVAGRLLTCVRETDVVCRLGGDEFAILQLPASGAEAMTLARRVIARLAEPFYIHGHEIHTSASIGIALFPHDGDDPERLMKHADLALYRAKAEGRDTFHFFLPGFAAEVEQRLALGRELRAALKADQLALEFQPLVDLASMTILGVEALVRWRHPAHGPVPPVQFIPVAEETGMIGTLTGWVLRKACQQARAWHDEGLAVTMAVNLSAVQFRQRGLGALVAQTLQATGLPGGRLELEITERALVRDPERAQDVLDTLAALGVGIALDDFGTGTSSLTSLRRFPFSKVKIDRSLVGEMCLSASAAAIIKAVIAVCKSLRIRIAAEAIETEDQLALLCAQGCEEAQGFLFARPLPACDVAGLLRCGPGRRALVTRD